MTWHPARFAPAFAVLGLCIACAHRHAAPPDGAAASPPMPASPSTMNTDEQARQGAHSLEQLLAGRIAGVIVKPGRNGGISVRMMGPTTFYAGADPLFIVDGVPIEAEPNGTLSWLSPHDVQSIQALKNPADIAMYGLRGTNGVIIIKTKGSH